MATLRNTAAYDSIIGPLATRAGVPVDLVKGIISVESQWNPDAENLTGGDAARGGSYGLMQMSLETAQGMGYTGTAEGLKDPTTNLTYGIQFLGWAYTETGGDYVKTAAAYNGGRLGASGTYTDQSYIDKVLAAAQSFVQSVTQLADQADAAASGDVGSTLLAILVTAGVAWGVHLWRHG